MYIDFVFMHACMYVTEQLPKTSDTPNIKLDI